MAAPTFTTNDKASQLAVAALVATQNDPSQFVRSMYPWGEPGTILEHYEGPRGWQQDILGLITEHLNGENWDQPLRVAVASGHGIGKSALISWLVHWAITTMVDANGVVTANTENQLRTKTWPEIRKWYNVLAVRQWFRVDNTVFRSQDPNYEQTWRMDASPWSEHNTEAFAGLHNARKRILCCYDEASAIHDRVFEVTQGALTDELTQILWVVFGNPTRPQGKFFDCFSRNRKSWNCRQIDSRDVEGTNKKEIAQWVEEEGEDSDFIRIRVRGLFPRGGSNQLISSEAITEASKRDLAPKLSDPLIFGIDVARFGGDQSVLQTRKGLVMGVHGTFKWRGLDTMELADRVIAKIIELKPQYVNVDGGGVGGGLVDVLRDRGFDIHEVAFGGAPDNRDYANKRAEMWCRMREWIKDGALPWDDQDLLNELENQTYRYRENKQNDLTLTPKDMMVRDGLPSPDTGDASALTFAIQVNPVADTTREYVSATGTAEMDYIPDWE